MTKSERNVREKLPHVTYDSGATAYFSESGQATEVVSKELLEQYDPLQAAYSNEEAKLLEYHQEQSDRFNQLLAEGWEILRSRSGFYGDESAIPKVLMLDQFFYQRAISDRSLGKNIPGFDNVIVGTPEDQSFLGLVTAFHELIHRWFDAQYLIIDQTDRGDDTVELNLEIRRWGTIVMKVMRGVQTNEPGIKVQPIGELINELGNFGWMLEFMKKMEHQSKIAKIAFGKEFGKLNYIREHIFDDHNGNALQLEAGSGHTKKVAYIDQDFVYWDKELRTYKVLALMSQLFHELSTTVGLVDGDSLLDVLIEAKSRPWVQSKLRKAIDGSFGRGFYKKMREIDYHDTDRILELLADVQMMLGKTERYEYRATVTVQKHQVYSLVD